MKSKFLSIPLIVVSLFFAAPVHAVPLTWEFSGSTESSSRFNGVPVVGGLDVKFRIFLDTDLVAIPSSLTGNDVKFLGPFQGELDLETFGVLPVFFMESVENFAPPQGGVVGVEYTEAGVGKSFINFPAIISADRAHLGQISPTAPTLIDTVHIGGPNGLELVVEVATFSATVSEPSFFFSTGNPDGLMATATRPGPASGANQETESGDDFVLPNQTRINSATITGLLPAGVSLSDVTQVRVEIYRVFPKDSDVARTSGPPTFSTPQVPTRVNSPSDVEFVDRDSADGNLTFSVRQLAASFTAANSVDTGIHPSPNQRTGGEESKSGKEVELDVTFTTPFNLPADHYFLVPQVLLRDPNQHFLWLSAPKPIVAPGTPFPAGTTDLQEWIRNAGLDPDWLRVATDIVGVAPPTFNTTFSLSGQVDVDGDGVFGAADLCPDTPAGAVVNSHGCSIDQLAPCAGPVSGGTWKNHGEYVSSVGRVSEEFIALGLISEEEAEEIIAAAARSNCGFKK